MPFSSGGSASRGEACAGAGRGRRQIAAAALARHVVRVDVLSGRDIGGGASDRAAVLHDRLSCGNRHARDLVAAGNRLTHRHRDAAELEGGARLEIVERGRHVVGVADDEGRLHWLTPLARKPPSTTIS